MDPFLLEALLNGVLLGGVPGVLVAMPGMAAVAAVHEEVQQRAGEQQQVGERAVDVRRVLGHQEERGDGQEGHQRQPRRRTEERGHVRLLSQPGGALWHPLLRLSRLPFRTPRPVAPSV